MPRKSREFLRRSAAAKRGWETRREGERQRAREQRREFERRSEAAKRGWKQRRERERKFLRDQEQWEQIQDWIEIDPSPEP